MNASATSTPSDARGQPDPFADHLRRLEDRLDRERRARREAEQLLESKSLELYAANRALSAAASVLEERVEERTRELSLERQRAVALAEVDALTGIANRLSFARHLASMLCEAREGPDLVAALLIDLDDFKAVNDSFGHAAGDALLVEFAGRLVEAVRPGDVVARLGGDEFAVVARDAGGSHGAVPLAHRLLATLSTPVTVGGRRVAATCSIGIAESTAANRDADDLLRDADLALYESKRTGRARVTLFESGLRADLERRTVREREARQAVLDDRIEPWYQPIHCCETGVFVGAEVLARWHKPSGEIGLPSTFIETLEGLGLLDAMMENLLLRAFGETAAAVANGSLEYLSINVSPTQFDQGWAISRLPALLARTGFPERALVIEITEDALFRNIDRTRSALATLTSMGIRIAIDDFGVGYSNFALLRQLPFDMLKLDRTLVADIETDVHARALAEGMMDLAARLGIQVVAEGVETAGQAALLQAAGYTALQGFGLARPARDAGTWFDVT